MNKSPIEGIFIDFDGVISKNSIDITLKYITDYISKFSPVSLSFVKNYYQVVNSFAPIDSLRLITTR